jgi:minor extracellular serine protease Vpr
VSDSPILKRADALGLTTNEASVMFEPLLEQQIVDSLNNLRSAGIQFRVVDNLTHVLHGVIIETYQPIDTVQSAAPHFEIYSDSTLQTSLDRSSRLIGAVEAHRLKTAAGVPLTGQGVVVAVLDTGIDYTHPDLGGTIGPSQKVLKGYDFVDDDADPIDRDGHGTEVAGIIAADGRLQGIAPGANLLAYRVVDRSGTVKSSDLIRALERASVDGADVVNLSLGTLEEIDALSSAVDNLVRSGVVVVAAIGNSADRAFGEPAARQSVIAVGASLNNVTTERDSEVIVNPGGYELIAYSMNGSKPSPKGVSGDLVFGKYAREEDLDSMDLRGKIVLAERGGDPGELVYFSEKEANVASRGAAGLIVYNSEGGLFVGNLIGPQNPPGYAPTIPVVSISNPDGAYLREVLNQGEEIQATLQTTVSSTVFADRVAVFSSRGPTSPFYIKPDILAPGVSINTTTIRGGYTVGDGTSFAAPHVAGAVALLLEEHPGLTPREVAGVLAPTSKVLTDRLKHLVSPFSQGSGRLDVLSAALSPLALEPHSFVFQLAGGQQSQNEALNLIPISDQDVSVSTDISWSYESNISLMVSPATVEVKGNSSSSITVFASLLNASPGVYEGRITFHQSGGRPDLTIPVVVSVNNASVVLEKVGDTYQVSVEADAEFTATNLTVISPVGMTNVYTVTHGRSTPIVVSESGEYWIEANIPTEVGTLYARAIYGIYQPTAPLAGISIRFLEIFGGFMLLTAITASVLISINRRNRRVQSDGV